MTIDNEISQSVTLTPDEVFDMTERAYKCGLWAGAYVPAKTFWKGVIAGALGAFTFVLLAWLVGD